VSKNGIEKRVRDLEERGPNEAKRYIMKVDIWPEPKHYLMEEDGTEGGRFIRMLTTEEAEALE
jgi:hypothetical protein